MKEYERLKMLEYPGGKLDIVIDSDTATEIDDPFAIAYALLSPERLNVKAIYAAPFAMNARAQDPKKGMLLSYKEIRHILTLMNGNCSPDVKVCRGSEQYMTEKKQPVVSEAAEDLISRAKEYTADRPLYIAALGAGTNIASAILSCPEITEKIVIVWLAGDDFDESPNVYNIYQDRFSAQVIFDSGVPLVHIPCNYVASHLITCIPELEQYIGGKNQLCDYLLDSVREYGKGRDIWGKQIWDVAVIAYLLSEQFFECEITAAPIITDNLLWGRDYRRHLMKNVKKLNRDKIFQDLFAKLGNCS